MRAFLKSVLFSVGVVIATAIAGCKTDGNDNSDCGSNTIIRSNENTYVVTVGMENSRFAGACAGSGYDAERMTRLFRSYTTNVKAFSNNSATKASVRAAMVEAAEKADLFIFYYSGHGGQQKFLDTGADEDDGMDEFLCLYDTYMRDNEVWEIISKCKGRVFMMFDACHSQDLYRSVKPMTLKAAMPLSVTHNKQGPVNLLVWAGCPANTYSYGSAAGGKMTNTLIKYFDSRKTYDYLWDEIERDSSLKQYEIVQRTIMGEGFVGKAVFQ